MSQYEQPELPLEWPTYDHYTIELRKGEMGGNMTVVRQHQARTRNDAYGLIDGLLTAAHGRDNVVWSGEEVDAKGDLFGLDPDGITWQINVVPPLSMELS